MNREQKESLFLLSIGTFLEYFDLMLYIHMAVLLNKIFLPQTDPLFAKLLAALAFCSTYVFRPIGGFMIGWLGDHVGRKNTIAITTLTMALCCLTMANLQPYSEIGIVATAIMLICRTLQGFSSLGEIVGAQLYLVETLKQPLNYFCTGIITLSARLGGLLALIVASVSSSFNWRIAFLFGTIIAVIGLAARTRLRETPEFADFKLRMAKRKEELLNMPGSNKVNLSLQTNIGKLNKKTILSYFIIQANFSVGFYIAYIYAGSFMQEKLGMAPEQVIRQNLKMTIFSIIATIIVVMFFIKKYHPLKIAKLQTIAFAISLPFLPYWLSNISNTTSLLFFQFVVFLTSVVPFCMEISCFKHIPISGRFTVLATTFGLGTALGNMVITFSLIPLTSYFGYYGLLVILVPMTAGLLGAVSHIRKLEIKAGLYHDYPDSTDSNPGRRIISNTSERYALSEEEDALVLNCEYSKYLISKIAEEEAKQGNGKIDLNLIKKAIILAKKFHGDQLRKTGEPFYSHPLATAAIVAGYKLSTNVIIGAILHDVVEDTDCSLQLIEKAFNPRIAELVFLATRTNLDKNQKQSKLSIEELIKNILEAGDEDAMLIKCADRLHNLKTASSLAKTKQEKLAIETLESILQYGPYAVDRCNINDKLGLEEKIYQYCKNIIALNNIEIYNTQLLNWHVES